MTGDPYPEMKDGLSVSPSVAQGIVERSPGLQSCKQRGTRAHFLGFQHSRFDSCSASDQLSYDVDLSAVIARRWIAPAMDRPAQRRGVVFVVFEVDI